MHAAVLERQSEPPIRIYGSVPLEGAYVTGCATQSGVGAGVSIPLTSKPALRYWLGLGGTGMAVVQSAHIANAATITAHRPQAKVNESFTDLAR